MLLLSPESQDEADHTQDTATAERDSQLEDAQNKTKQLRYLKKEHDEFLRIELEIIALEDEITAEKRLIKRYRTLSLLPAETCDNIERQARMSDAYQNSITGGWRNIADTREKIARLESTQRRLMSTRSSSFCMQ